MKAYIQILLISLIGFGCKESKVSKSKYKIPSFEVSLEKSEEYGMTKEDIERDEFYGFDTLLIKKYKSESGHKIRLEGSKSKDIYRVYVESKQGITNNFKITDNWYIASHASIVWDNDDYIFVNYGCGTSCHGGLILSLNDNRGIIEYQGHIYEDSVRNLVVYPDSNNLQQIVIENFDKQIRISSHLNLCRKSAIPMEMIDTIFITENELFVIYNSESCQSKETRNINIEEIIY